MREPKVRNPKVPPPERLGAAFVRAAGGAENADLEAQISACFAAARKAWPRIAVDPEAFAKHLGRHANDGRLPALDRMADLHLAFACAEGVEAALSTLDPILVEAVRCAVARVDSSPSFADDVAQVLREKLLLSRPPKIAEYAGRASLRTWLATAAIRTALNLRRRKGDAAGATFSPDDSTEPALRDPELDYLRKRYRKYFAAAVRAALSALAPDERAILALNLGEGASIDKLAAIYSVSRATAARRLAAARERLIDDTRAWLCNRLRITASEYESLAAIMRSDLHVSVLRLLRENKR